MPAAAAALLVVAAFPLGCARPPRDGPALSARHVAGFAGLPIELTGVRFGRAGPDREVVVTSGPDAWRVASTSDAVLAWEEDRIELRLPDAAQAALAPGATLRVRTPWGTSAPAQVALFAYDWFALPGAGGRVSPPLALAVDALRRVWIHQEFHTAIHALDPITGAIARFALPVATDPGPFATRLYGGAQTFVSELGEDILVDPAGRVWLTQGGGFLYEGPYRNRSRIVSFAPEDLAKQGGGFRIWTVPGDHNEAKGIEWDPGRRRIWFSEGGAGAGARLTSFDPERLTPDGDGSAPGPGRCAPGETSGACFLSFPLPDPGAQPAHVRIDRDGHVWTAGSWSNALYRLDPESGAVVAYPLPPSQSDAREAAAVGACPWQLRIGPDARLYFNEFFDASLGRFDALRADDPACTRLDEAGRNPCIDELDVVGAQRAGLRIHSIAFDARGRLWFSGHDDSDGSLATLGFATPDWREVVRLPPLARFPADRAPASAGIAVDPVTGDVWFAEFWRGRIGRLREVGG
jgi:streptogramin lyase